VRVSDKIAAIEVVLWRCAGLLAFAWAVAEAIAGLFD
jgi:hypothetical protein